MYINNLQHPLHTVSKQYRYTETETQTETQTQTETKQNKKLETKNSDHDCFADCENFVFWSFPQAYIEQAASSMIGLWKKAKVESMCFIANTVPSASFSAWRFSNG